MEHRSSKKSISSRKSNKDIKSALEYRGTDLFQFANGDVYVGQFTASRKEEIFRDGFGKYFCEDGSLYEGTWNEDSLIFSKNTTFSNNDSYEGPLREMKYSGEGVYNMSQVGELKTMFNINFPTGEIVLTDPCGFVWKGVTSAESKEVMLVPDNHFKINFT